VRPTHGDPLLRRVRREVLRTVGASASRDVHDRTARVAGLQRPVTTGRRIVVTSARGGAGKSTVSALIGAILSYYRQDRVLAMDADPGLGSLPMRLGAGGGRTLSDLTRAGRPASFDDLRPYLTTTHTGLWLLPGDGGVTDPGVHRAVAADLSRFFAVTVVDCGGGLMSGSVPGLLADAHAQLLVTPATPDGAISARGALEWLSASGLGGLVPRTLTVFVTHAPHGGVDLTRAAELLRADGAHAVAMGYDRHLAAGAPIDENRLAADTRIAAERVAAEALAVATSEGA
jgi:MinD-like ATPase involved in chromosome partitioning or flagellar assembly